MILHAFIFLISSATLTPALDLKYLDPVILQTKSSPHIQQTTATILIERYTPKVTVQVNPQLFQEHKDTFYLKTNNGTLHITASTGVAAVWGFNYYLKKYCKSHIGWQVKRVVIPDLLPDADEMVIANDRFRYFSNVYTTSISFAWWRVVEWQKHVNWMALNGINIALAPVAEEAAYTKLYKDLGITQEELDEFFGGPAYVSWSRTGYIRGWGGPLPQNWHETQKYIQLRIVEYMYQFGIIPVFPAFNGHVPRGFTRLVDNSSTLHFIQQTNNFDNRYCCGLFLNPLDPTFKMIGKMFLKEISDGLTLSNVYNVDPFNKLKIKPWSTSFIIGTVNAIYGTLTEFDRNAVWLIPNSMFVHYPEMWPVRRVKSFLTVVPKGRMLVLDMQSEQWPQFDLFEMYYGQPFIWCMLHNIGGTSGMFGNMKVISKNVFPVRSRANSTMIGIGLTPEGINQNYVIYDMMLENAWRKKPIENVTAWATEYAERRYGCNDTLFAWKYLVQSVYRFDGLNKINGEYVVTLQPSFNIRPWAWYNLRHFFAAFREFSSINNTECHSPGFKHDLIDVTRQALQYRADQVYLRLRGDRFKLSKYNKTITLFLDVMHDMELILSGSENFKATNWLTGAKNLATNPEEERLYEFNARTQITLWGPNGELRDYASKQWAELFHYYYTPRWEAFLTASYHIKSTNGRFNEEIVKNEIRMLVEEPFQKVQIVPLPETDAIPLARALYEKWGTSFDLVELPQSVVRHVTKRPDISSAENE